MKYINPREFDVNNSSYSKYKEGKHTYIEYSTTEFDLVTRKISNSNLTASIGRRQILKKNKYVGEEFVVMFDQQVPRQFLNEVKTEIVYVGAEENKVLAYIFGKEYSFDEERDVFSMLDEDDDANQLGEIENSHITAQNYEKEYPKIKDKLPAKDLDGNNAEKIFRECYDFLVENDSNKQREIQEVKEIFAEKANKALGKSAPAQEDEDDTKAKAKTLALLKLKMAMQKKRLLLL